MKNEILVIVPPIVCHNLDPHTGIPFMPHMAAHLVGQLTHSKLNKVYVFDCFGLQPNNTRIIGEFMLLGADENWVLENISQNTGICFIYCRTIAEFIAIEKLIFAIRKKFPEIKIILFENIQSVTSYSLKGVSKHFLEVGAYCLIFGEPEDRVLEICDRINNQKTLEGIPGIAYSGQSFNDFATPAELKNDLDSFPMPGWELFNLEGYWKVGFGHAPVTRNKFLPILTSRGCPYRCTFCIAPEVNPKWRYRTAKHVVDEMEYFYKKMGITDFHISDLDPTVSEKRTIEICNEIINRKLKITWKLAQGTKIETIKSESTLEIMAEAGCKFISFSPESGSPRLLKIMNKPFDHEHGLKMTKKMNSLGIRSQAVFIGGVPGEMLDDQKLSIKYAKKLIKAGVDEISLVIFTPLPGAKLSKEINDFTHYSQCTPSPSWRKDYQQLTRYRYKMYLSLLVYKAIYHPLKLIGNIARLFTLQFETKMEMSIFKQIKLYLLFYFPWLWK
jgi:radical SAM superfamily enzyme YgiQ (UPF0313 family)